MKSINSKSVEFINPSPEWDAIVSSDDFSSVASMIFNDLLREQLVHVRF